MVFKSPTIDVPKTKLFSSFNKFEVIFAFVNPVTLRNNIEDNVLLGYPSALIC